MWDSMRVTTNNIKITPKKNLMNCYTACWEDDNNNANADERLSFSYTLQGINRKIRDYKVTSFNSMQKKEDFLVLLLFLSASFTIKSTQRMVVTAAIYCGVSECVYYYPHARHQPTEPRIDQKVMITTSNHDENEERWWWGGGFGSTVITYYHFITITSSLATVLFYKEII